VPQTSLRSFYYHHHYFIYACPSPHLHSTRTALFGFGDIAYPIIPLSTALGLHLLATNNMAWQPQEGQLTQLAQYLKDSLTPQDKTVQKNAELVRPIQHEISLL
jgi:hypothetical protein